MMARSRQFHALAHQRVEFQRQLLRGAFFVRRLSRFQHLFYSVQQALRIEQHQLVKLLPLPFFYLASLQGLQVELDRSDRSLQFMSDRVDKAVVLLVAANFPDQKDGIEDEAGDDGAEENDAEKNSDALTPVEDDPTAADGEGHRRQANAEREEKVDCLLAADDAHREIVAGRVSGVRHNGCISAIGAIAISTEEHRGPKPRRRTNSGRAYDTSSPYCLLPLPGRDQVARRREERPGRGSRS